ncbi:hypothetical protein FSPOR_3530 [Fusarium sporotrichioides]|uniref:Uncharacterized protein n=1 Tax=Fusarium sporotrichioides TaxID=5514 RepID=A0A395SGG5_FUSSP|nr:hypothetical protein FSPOR_3530 [Fusarium sporotrichioides]
MPVRPMPPGHDWKTGLVWSGHIDAHEFVLDSRKCPSNAEESRYVKSPGHRDAVIVSFDFEDLCLAKAVPPILPGDPTYSVWVVALEAYSNGVALALDGDGTIDDDWVIETLEDIQVQVRESFCGA